MARKNFKFKSSGIRKREVRKLNKPDVIIRPIGFKTPMKLGSAQSDLYEMHINPVLQIKDNLRNLIQTNYGERIGRPEYGANLSNLTFELAASENFLKEASLRIDRSIKKYMPIVIFKDVNINNLESINNVDIASDKLGASNSKALALLELRVTYDIPNFRLQNQILDVLIYAGG